MLLLLNQEVWKYKEVQEIRNEIEFPKVFLFEGKEVLCCSCQTTFAISQRSLPPNLKQHVEGHSHQKPPPTLGQLLTLPHFSTTYQRAHKIATSDLTQRGLASNFVMDSFLNITNIMSATRKFLLQYWSKVWVHKSMAKSCPQPFCFPQIYCSGTKTANAERMKVTKDCSLKDMVIPR